MSYNSKYTGQQVEALLDIVSQGGGTGGEGGEVQKTTEAEILAMGFTKNEGTITEVKMNGVSKGTSGVVDLGTVITEHQDISGKVDKVTGKQLSTEDFTTALKQKLEGLSNYNDAEINEAVSSLQTQLNTLVSGNANDAINSFNEIIAFLDGIKDSQDLSSIIESIEQQIASKMDKVTLANVATSGSYNDLNDKPTIPSAVTESTVSGWGFTKNTGTYSKPSGGIPKSDLASAVQTSLGKADTALQSYTEQYKGTVTGVKINGTTKNPSSGVVDLGTVITSHQDISGKQDKLVSGTNIKTINNTSILGSGNISITGGSGTITGVSANGTSIATSGVANIPAATTSKYGVTQLSSSTSSTSTTLAATPSAVKSAYDLANGKQDKLVSGTNIKTINGTSILGSGNITISGGGGSSSGGAYAEVNHGTSDTTFTLTPNTFHVWDEVAALDLSFCDETAGVANEFVFQFTSGASATTLTLPDSIKWANDTAPTIAENTIYQMSVLKGLASVLEFKNSLSVTFIVFTVGAFNCVGVAGMTWEEWVNSEYNTYNAYVSGSYITMGGGAVSFGGSPVIISSEIIENMNYIILV